MVRMQYPDGLWSSGKIFLTGFCSNPRPWNRNGMIFLKNQ
jgi:hypothetical protein